MTALAWQDAKGFALLTGHRFNRWFHWIGGDYWDVT